MSGTNGSTSLAIKCPHCGVYDNHLCTYNTERRLYRWNYRATVFLKERYGKDICYRSRRRMCTNCQKYFNIAEVSKDYLGQILDDLVTNTQMLSRYQKRYEQSSKELEKVIAELKEAKAKIRCITRVVGLPFLPTAVDYEQKNLEG